MALGRAAPMTPQVANCEAAVASLHWGASAHLLAPAGVTATQRIKGPKNTGVVPRPGRLALGDSSPEKQELGVACDQPVCPVLCGQVSLQLSLTQETSAPSVS